MKNVREIVNSCEVLCVSVAKKMMSALAIVRQPQRRVSLDVCLLLRVNLTGSGQIQFASKAGRRGDGSDDARATRTLRPDRDEPRAVGPAATVLPEHGGSARNEIPADRGKFTPASETPDALVCERARDERCSEISSELNYRQHPAPGVWRARKRAYHWS